MRSIDDSEIKARMGKRFFKLIKTLEVYGETASVKDTAQILGVTQDTVERRLSVAVQEYEDVKKWLKEMDKYKYVLFRKETAHSKRISILCMIGRAVGFKTWIAINERSYLCNIKGKERILSDLLDFWKKPELLKVNRQIWNFLKFIDVMWIKDQRIYYAFEVETTTSFINAFDRCSNIPSEHNAVKVIVIPRKRRNLLLDRIQSNLIKSEIYRGNWYLLDFHSLKQFNDSSKPKKDSVFRDILESIST